MQQRKIAVVTAVLVACSMLSSLPAKAEDPTWTFPAQRQSHPHVTLRRSVHVARYGGHRFVRYNPAWQAAPGDTSCCPNNMLVCPLGRHFCGH